MENNNLLHKNRLFIVSFSALVMIAILLSILSFIPQSRELIRSIIISQSRVILSKASADLPGGGGKVAVIKVHTADTMAIEVYESDTQGFGATFIKRVVLPESRDAYFNFHSQTTNLVVNDLDGDGQLEIIAPTFDEDLVPHLNVYRYDMPTKELIRLGPENFNL